MPLPSDVISLLTVCGIQVPKRDCCVPLPGGAEICVQLPQVGIPDPIEIQIMLFAQVNAALAPMAPVFRILDVVLALVECIKAIPKAIFPPNPAPVIQCIVKLVEVVVEILKLVPPFSLLFTVAAILDCLILFLGSLDTTIRTVIEKNAALLAASLAPATPGAAFIIACEKGNLDAYVKNLNEAMKPLNRLLGVINLFMTLAGQDGIPPFDAIGSTAAEAEAFLDPLSATVTTLRTIRSFIPV